MRPRRTVLVASWFVAVLVVAPLAWLNHDGWVLLLDWSPGPRSGEVDWLQLPSGPLLNAVVAVAAALDPRLVGVALPSLAAACCFVAGSVFASRWRCSLSCALAGGAAACAAPFVVNRVYVGQLGMVFGTALLLVTAAAVLDAVATGKRFATIVWGSLACACSLQMIVPVLVVVACGALLIGRRRSTSRARHWFVVSAGFIVLATAAWTAPTLALTSEQLSSPGTAAGVAVFAVDGEWWRLPDLLLTGAGFWRETPPALTLPAVVFAAACLAALVVRWRVGAGWTRDVRTLAVVPLVCGVVAASSGRGPLAPLWNTVVSSIPFVGLYREAGKMLAFTVPAVAIGGAALASGRRAVAVPLTALMCLAAAFTLSQVAVAAPATQYPSDWARVAASVGEAGAGCRLAVIGDEAYTQPAFTAGRVVANPAIGFFGAVGAVSGDPRVEGLPPRNADDAASAWVWAFHRAVEAGESHYDGAVEAGVGWAMVDRPSTKPAEVAVLEESRFELVFRTDQVGLWRTVEGCS